MQSIENALVQTTTISSIIDNNKYNKIIIDYYRKFAEEFEDNYKKTLENKIVNLENCNNFWLLDKYQEQKIKDLKKQNLCKDKFCSNCKKVKQSARMSRYIPELEKHKGNLYHLTLTVPNCSGENLKVTYKIMAKAFRQLIRYIRGTDKVKGINFNSFSYKGAVRSLEVTFKGNEYHPHFHVGIILDSNVLGKKSIENTYSYDYRKGVPELKRLFSKEEILIQKIWFLLINGRKVTVNNIWRLKEGYSCTMDKFKENDFAELFKYITKEKDEEGNLLTYDNFKTLYKALYRLKQIQGYGCLFQITDDIDVEEYESLYKEFIENIRKKESPVEVLERPQELLLDNQYKLISRKSYFKYLRELYHNSIE